MDRIPVESSNIDEIGYDAGSMTVEVLFKKSGLYQYFDVPENVFAEFLQSESKGKFFNGCIKGHYRETRL